MIELSVCRNSSVIGECLETDTALNWGADISDALLTTFPAGSERGRVEIDSVYSNRKEVGLSLPYTTWVQPGEMVEIVEGTRVVNGLLQNISIKHSISGDTIQVGSNISVEREV